MRKGRDRGEKKQGGGREKTDDYSGHYAIASSRPPERRPQERRTLVPINLHISLTYDCQTLHIWDNLHDF